MTQSKQIPIRPSSYSSKSTDDVTTTATTTAGSSNGAQSPVTAFNNSAAEYFKCPWAEKEEREVSYLIIFCFYFPI